jgi:hypothetical protein
VQSIAPTSGPMTRVPDDKLMRLFDGFTRVSESDLPKEIDMFHLGVEGDEFNRLFKFRDGEP